MNSDLYHFTSARLGFRSWQEYDLPALHSINADPQVMKYFPKTLSETESKEFMERMNQQYIQRNYCYFAVDLLESFELIGFIGLSYQDFKSPYTPCVDIGWRIKPKFWGQGLATEGAIRCLDYGFNTIGLETIRAIAPANNKASVSVMQRSGMQLKGTFSHPALQEYTDLAHCVCYEITTENFLNK